MIFQNSKLLLILLSVLALALVGFLALDAYNIRARNLEAARMLSLLGEAENQILLIQSVRAFRQGASESLSAFEELVLTEDKLVSAIESIEAAGRSLGLETRIVSVDKVAAPAGEEVERVNLSVETIGPWSGTYLFAKALESLPHRSEISTAHLSKRGGVWESRTEVLLYSFQD